MIRGRVVVTIVRARAGTGSSERTRARRILRRRRIHTRLGEGSRWRPGVRGPGGSNSAAAAVAYARIGQQYCRRTSSGGGGNLSSTRVSASSSSRIFLILYNNNERSFIGVAARRPMHRYTNIILYIVHYYIVYIKLQFFRTPILQGIIVCGFFFYFPNDNCRPKRLSDF